MKDRSEKARSYTGELMGIGEPAEAYIARYLEREYVKVMSVGKERRRRDYRCFSANGKVELIEGKTDTKIAQTKKIPWEVFRLENGGMRCYVSWGYASQAVRVVYFVPQWLKLLDIRVEDIRRVIFEHLMAKGREVFVAPTLTDRDRITFNFLVPLSLLREKDVLKEVDIAEIPLAAPVPYQARLNGAKKDTAPHEAGSELERLRANWRQIVRDASPDMSRTPAAALLRSAKPKAIENKTVVLSFKFPLHKENMEKPDNLQVAEKIISNFLGRPCRVRSVYEPEDNHLIEEALKIGAQIIDAEVIDNEIIEEVIDQEHLSHLRTIYYEDT